MKIYTCTEIQHTFLQYFWFQCWPWNSEWKKRWCPGLSGTLRWQYCPPVTPGAQYLLLRCLHLWIESKSGGNSVQQSSSHKISMLIWTSFTHSHFTGFGRWGKIARCWILNLPATLREAVSAWCQPRKPVFVLPLNLTVFKARQRMGCPGCTHRGEMARCFNGVKLTHVKRLRAGPGPGVCTGQLSCLPCPLPKPRHCLDTPPAKERSRGRQEEKVTQLLNPIGDF